MTDRRHLQTFHPFARLNRLLDGIPPGRSGIDVPGMAAGAPILLSVGEPQNQPPAFVAEELARAAAGWSRYPPPRGTLDYAETCAAWLARRYGPAAAALVDAKTMILPLAGTREGLFFAALATTPADGQPPPAILMPNPFYHVYAGAIAASGAEPHFLPATRANGFMPSLETIDRDVLARTAMAFVCSPSNPQGAIAPRAYLENWIRLAREHNFTVVFDECYSEIYDDAPPPVGMAACAALGGSLKNVLVFNSLSKRSSVPGLRSGFVAGDPDLVRAFKRVRDYGGAPAPLPLLAASTALWQDEEHVEDNRALYRAKFDLADRILGDRLGYRRPGGGFYLWLDVGDGEDAARRLWREAALRVLPGAYLAKPDADGVNPGARYIRCALVQDLDTTAEALSRLARVL